ncbi:hypothetical protein [Paractinoplanes tereljensis]|uniref:hypothetical protein n=1 Tax=Paractinoplanes tereljensis TaxID=571912 RepID=UPI001942C483|nr:hypothetical protein [Actinoplanes tereljensis]
MTRPGAPALDGPRIDRWVSAAVPWWVPRLVLFLGWVAAGAVALATDNATGGYGPDLTFAVAVVVWLATPVLLWWLPLAGCAAGVIFAVLDVLYDDVPAASVAFGIHGLLCLATMAWLVSARRRQAAVVAEVAGTVRLDEALAGRLRESLPAWGLRTVAAVLLAMAGIGGIAWYDHRAAQVAQHESAATRTEGVIRSADNSEGVVVVEVPQPVRVGVLDSYQVGQVVPVLVDGDWVRLVAEPEDVTGWLSAGLGSLVLAGLLLFREQRMRSARRRLLSGPLPAVELTADPDEHGRAVLHGGLAVLPVEAAPIRFTRPQLTGEDVDWTDGWPAEQAEDFGEDWRGDGQPDEPATVTVAGDLRDGGWVLLITDSAVLLPEAPLRTPMGRPAAPDTLPGKPLPPTDPGDLPDLPLVLRPRRRDRVLGALSLLGFAAGPALVLAGVPDGWWETIIVLWLGGVLTYQGWGRLTSRVRLTRGGIEVYDRTRVHQVPWQRLHGVRCDDKGLWLAWDPDITARVSGVAERWGAVMLRLRDLSLAAGDPGGQASARLGSGPGVVLAYVLVAAAAMWV